MRWEPGADLPRLLPGTEAASTSVGSWVRGRGAAHQSNHLSRFYPKDPRELWMPSVKLCHLRAFSAMALPRSRIKAPRPSSLGSSAKGPVFFYHALHLTGF